jgi:hypothetical protein
MQDDSSDLRTPDLAAGLARITFGIDFLIRDRKRNGAAASPLSGPVAGSQVVPLRLIGTEQHGDVIPTEP